MLFFQVGYVNSTYPEGLSINTFDGLVLNTLNINCLIKQNRSIAFSLQSDFTARGAEPTVKILFNKGDSTPVLIGNASIVIDAIVYYHPNGTRYLETGTFYEHLIVEPQHLTDEIFYDIGLKNMTGEVFNHFSAEQQNVRLDDVGFYGRLSLGTEFENATGIVSRMVTLALLPVLTGT